MDIKDNFAAEQLSTEVVPYPQTNPVDYVYNDLVQKAEPKTYLQEESDYNDNKNLIGQMFAGPNAGKLSFEEDSLNINEAYTRLSTGEYITRYDKGYKKGIDNEDLYAQNQSTGEKWLNGLSKFGLKTLNNVVGGTLGTAWGAINAIGTGNWERVYDNGFYDMLDDYNTKLDNFSANYVGQDERDLNFGQSALTANFWANDFLGGLSFLTGTLISESLWAASTGGTSLATTAGRVGLRASKYFNTVKNLSQGLKKAGQTWKVFGKIDEAKYALDAAKKYGQLGKTAQLLRFTYTGAGFEAGMEARLYQKEQTENFYRDFEQLNGRKPDPLDVANFKDNLDTTTNVLFATNLALVGTSNVAILGKTFGVVSPFKTSNQALNKVLLGTGTTNTLAKKAGQKGGQRLSTEVIQRNAAQKAFGGATSILKAPFMEGFVEEGGQAASSSAMEAYVTSRYNPSEDVMGIVESMYEGLSHTYGTKEGWKEVGLGALIGLLGGGKGAIRDFKGAIAKEDYNSAKQAEAMNNQKGTDITDRFKAVSERVEGNILQATEIQNATQRLEEATERGDAIGVSTAQQEIMLSSIAPAVNFDYLDEQVEDFQIALDMMEDKEVMDTFGVSQEQVKDKKKELVNNYRELGNDYKRGKESLDYIFSDNPKETDENGKPLPMDMIKSTLLHQMLMTQHLEKTTAGALTKLQEKLQELSPRMQEAYSKALEDFNKYTKSKKEVVDKIEAQEGKIRSLKENKEKLLTEQDKLRSKMLLQDKEANKTLADKSNKISERIDSITIKIQEEQDNKSTIEQDLYQATETKNSSENVLEATKKRLDSIDPLAGSEVESSTIQSTLEKLEQLDKDLAKVQATNPQLTTEIRKIARQYRYGLEQWRTNSDVLTDVFAANASGELNLNRIGTLIQKKRKAGKTVLEILEKLNDYNLQQTAKDFAVEQLVKNAKNPNKNNQEDFENDPGADPKNDTPPTPTQPLTQEEREAEIAKLKESKEPLIKRRDDIENSEDEALDETAGLNSKETVREKQIKEIEFTLALIDLQIFQLEKGIAKPQTQAQIDKEIADKKAELVALESQPAQQPTSTPNQSEIEAPTLSTVKINLSTLNISELENVAKQLRQKAVNARNAEKQGQTVLGGSVSIENDYQEVKKYITKLKALEQPTVTNQSGVKTNEQKVEELRAAEQVELKTALPNAQLNSEGKIATEKLSKEDKLIYNEIYNRYDKLITPLLEKALGQSQNARKTQLKKEIAELEKLKDTSAQNTPPTQQEPQTPVQKKVAELKERLKQILEKNTDLERFSTEEGVDESAKPTQEELDEYDAIEEAFTSGDLRKLVGRPVDKIGKRAKGGLTNKQIERYQELSRKFTEWRVVSGSNNGTTSVQELLDEIAMYEMKLAENDTQITAEDALERASQEATEGSNSNMNTNYINSPSYVVVRMDPSETELSHLKLSNLVDAGYGVVDQGQDNKGTEQNPHMVTNYAITKGDKTYYIQVSSKHGRMYIPNKSAQEIFKDMGVQTVKYNSATGWGFIFQNGKAMKSSFSISEVNNPNISILDDQKIYELKKGDKLGFVVNMNDKYNQEEIMEFLRQGDIQKAADQLQIYMVNSNGDVVGVLQANHSMANEDTKNFNKVRQAAIEAFQKRLENSLTMEDILKGNNDVTIINLPFEVEVEKTFLGTPNIEINEDGVAKTFPVTQQHLDEGKVISIGYAQDGKVQEPDDVRKTFIPEGKSTTYVVLSHKGAKVAFPISLTPTVSAVPGQIMDILESNQSDSEKIIAIGTALKNAGIEPANYNLELLVPNKNAEELALIFEDINSNIPSYTKEEVEKMELSKLLETAELIINLDEDMFLAPKVKTNLSSNLLNKDTKTTSADSKMSEEQRVDLIMIHKETLSKAQNKREVAAMVYSTMDDALIDEFDQNEQFKKQVEEFALNTQVIPSIKTKQAIIDMILDYIDIESTSLPFDLTEDLSNEVEALKNRPTQQEVERVAERVMNALENRDEVVPASMDSNSLYHVVTNQDELQLFEEHDLVRIKGDLYKKVNTDYTVEELIDVLYEKSDKTQTREDFAKEQPSTLLEVYQKYYNTQPIETSKTEVYQGTQKRETELKEDFQAAFSEFYNYHKKNNTRLFHEVLNKFRMTPKGIIKNGIIDVEYLEKYKDDLGDLYQDLLDYSVINKHIDLGVTPIERIFAFDDLDHNDRLEAVNNADNLPKPIGRVQTGDKVNQIKLKNQAHRFINYKKAVYEHIGEDKTGVYQIYTKIADIDPNFVTRDVIDLSNTIAQDNDIEIDDTKPKTNTTNGTKINCD